MPSSIEIDHHNVIPLKNNEVDNTFLLSMEERSYNEQYSNLYLNRLKKLRVKVYNKGSSAWSGMVRDGIPVKYSDKVLDLGKNRISWTVGTIYRDMGMKPSILEEVTASHFGAPPAPPEKYTTSELDDIYLEDESGRVKLTGDSLQSKVLLTGCVVAVLGSEMTSGDFEVADVRFAEYAPQQKKSRSQKAPSYIAVLSGLLINRAKSDDIKYQILKDFFRGEVGNSQDRELSSKISHLIIAGDSNSINQTDDMKEAFDSSALKSNETSASLGFKSVQQLDGFLNELSSTVAVTVMPGSTDISNISLPQQPLHKALFRKSKEMLQFQSFETVTNPYKFLFNDIEILGDSGQPIDDIFKYFKESEIDRVDIINQCLRWQTIAPTAPDTLSSYPFTTTDPFTLTSTPHIYLSGNQPSFDSRLFKGMDENDNEIQVRVITIPQFHKTGELVLIDINDDSFPTFSLKFGIS